MWGCSEKNKSYQNKHYIYYVGGKSYKLQDIVKLFEEISGKQVNIEWGAIPYRDNQPLKCYIGQLLPNWKPVIELKDGIEQLLKT